MINYTFPRCEFILYIVHTNIYVFEYLCYVSYCWFSRLSKLQGLFASVPSFPVQIHVFYVI